MKRSITRRWSPCALAIVLLAMPVGAIAQEIPKILTPVLGRAKQETAEFASRRLSGEIAKTLGFTPLLTRSRGDRSLSARERRNARDARDLFLKYWQDTPSANAASTAPAASPSSAVIRHYEVLNESDLQAIEQALQPALNRIRQEIDHPRPPGAIAVQPNQKRLILFQGYCLDKGIAAPRTQEEFRLVPVSDLLPDDAAPFYHGLLQYGQQSGRNNEVQGLIWRLVHGVHPEHAPEPLAANESRMLDEAVPGGAQAFYHYLQEKHRQSEYGLTALYQNQAREMVQDVINQYVNPVFGNAGISLSLYRQDLNAPGEIGDYLNRLAQIPIEGVTENGSEFTMLGDRVAARSLSTRDVREISVEIVNVSGAVYYYQPLQYVGFSTRMTQPVGHYPKDPAAEEDPLLVASIEQILLFLQENEALLEYAGYALDAFLIVTGPGGMAVRLGIGAAAKYIARHPGKLKELWEAFLKTIGKKGTIEAGKVALTSFDDVAGFIIKNGKLPPNFITKAEAKSLGWEPRLGNLNTVAPGKSIGGDIFKNAEGLLPKANGRIWIEADINYTGGMRGGERLLYSNDGLIYRTTDHYKTFTRIK